MIAILSPAKTLNMEKTNNMASITMPIFLKEAASLMKELKKYSPPEMEGLMKINPDLAEQNFIRHQRWVEEHSLSNAKQALLAYDGAVFQGLDAKSLNEQQLTFAHSSLRVLSGLYGVVRPLDLIQPYRLEMQTKLRNPSGNDLYSFWKDKLTFYFKEEIEKASDKILIDLASKEYSSAIDFKKINAQVITPVFRDYKNGSFKIITIYAKRARGLMSRFIAENSITKYEDLKHFNVEGYSYDENLSDELIWVFTRHNYK